MNDYTPMPSEAFILGALVTLLISGFFVWAIWKISDALDRLDASNDE